MERIIFKHDGACIIVPVTNKEALSLNYDESQKVVKVSNGSYETVIAREIANSGEADQIIAKFLSSVPGAVGQGDRASQKFKTSHVFFGCLLVIILAVIYSLDKPSINDETMATNKTDLAPDLTNVTISQEQANVILSADLPIEKRIEIAADKEKMSSILSQMASMTKNERLDYIQSPEVQELLSKSWAVDLQE